ncbi:LacI family DNA-binding transcriptional regulator [Hymenobacter wooponensis]|uniref:LacI family DNA-binding transcriptional regulator n=1 Tax=Hymenobacter wooponensis TaxID=1525360 RepID=A0A4Z0MDS2_9BACT|nr:substrate-binding domain-containing protein [Hymenobacter wooponensis]TGD77666.1 LacI family DNA-binding transcriptional regulator [Hymenobacter wooponensis]
MGTTAVRIKDIAAKANVSVGTVDRVLHNRGRVSEPVRQRVLRMMQELAYEPNLLARTLGTNSTHRVAVLQPDHTLDPYWQAPWEGIEQAARELKPYGVSLTFYPYDLNQVGSFVEQAEQATLSRPDGILVAPLFYQESLAFFARWQQQSIPYVLFNTYIEEASPLSYVGQDSYQSGFLAGKLVQFGQPPAGTFLIAHIAEDIANSLHITQKEKGFRDYFAHLALNPLPAGRPETAYRISSLELPHPADPAFARRLNGLLDEEGTQLRGIFVSTSKAYEIAPYLQAYQRDDVRLVGYDLLAQNMHFLREGVIHFLINQNPKQQGYRGVFTLADQLIFKKPVSPLYYLPLDIITQENLQYYLDK